jgi:hypothetical protein
MPGTDKLQPGINDIRRLSRRIFLVRSHSSNRRIVNLIHTLIVVRVRQKIKLCSDH